MPSRAEVMDVARVMPAEGPSLGAEDNADAPQAAHDDTAQNGAEAVQCGVEPLDDVADIDAHGADDHQHDGNHDQQGQAGDKDQLKDFRYDLVEQPFQKRQ